MVSLSKPRYLLRSAQALFILNAVIWAVIGIMSLTRLGSTLSDQPAMALILSILMFGNAAAMLWCGWAIGRQKMLYIYLAMSVLIVNLSLTITDQFGFLDLVTLLIDLVLLVVLVVLRNRHKVGNNGIQP
jgi:hypothetical protein